MADVAKREGLDPTMGQSPFALARGETFERALFRDDAKRLLDALIEASVLQTGSSGFLDLRLRMNGGPVADHQAAYERTCELLRSAAEAGAKRLRRLPAVVASATLRLPGQPVMLPEGVVAIDALVLRPEDRAERIELVIGEIKTYPDRAGHTDVADLATSRAQAGVYLHALRVILDDLGLAHRLSVASSGFLILTRTGRNDPSVRTGENLDFQARRAERGFRRLRIAAERLQPFDPADDEKGIRAVLEASKHYRATCLEFCDRAAGCRKHAEGVGDPSVLGDEVKRFLGETSLSRAVELLQGAEPVNATERDLAVRIGTALGKHP